MLVKIGHRGPDGRGAWFGEGVALGSVLLAIVDIGHGQQPFLREARGERFVAVFNGEIYNHEDLRRDLEREGFAFRTRCDTEVALAAYAAWGPDAVRRFDGQWALVVWEERRRRLFLSRDPFGIKPLFYSSRDGAIAFGSEPKALLALPFVPRRPNLDAVREYFLHGFAFAAGYSLNHRSFFEGIASLPPGHSLAWEQGREPEVRRDFEYPLQPELSPARLAEAPRLLGDAVCRSTRASLMGDAPIGVALSGGLDSSVITTIAAKAAAEAGRPPLLASCITYGAQLSNEDEAHARRLAEWLAPERPVDLVFSRMTLDSYLDDLDRMIVHFDEPHWEVKQLAMFNNYRRLKEAGAKVVLTGEGADELFFGYYHNFPGFKSPVIRTGDELLEVWGARVPVARRLLAGASEEDLEGLQREALARFYEPLVARGAGPERAMQCWYLATFLHWLLIDNDRCSMAFSLEGRFPFLNREVYDLAFQIPPAAQLGDQHGQEKLVLREAFRSELPEEIWRRRRKAPLPSPSSIGYHRVVHDALEREVAAAPASAWDILDRDGVESFLVRFRARLVELEEGGGQVGAGGSLTSYLRLTEPWDVRTPQAFGLLTFFRWWSLNFA